MKVQRTSEIDGVAMAALVVGIASLVFFLPLFFVLGPLAMYLGHSASARIRRSGGALSGEGLALAGRILGAVSFALGLLGVVVLLALGQGLTARPAVHFAHANLQRVSVQSQGSAAQP